MPTGTVIQHPQWPQRPRPPWPGGPWECSCGTDPCTCGCQPNWSQDAIRCWNEMQQFTEMVRQIIQCELARAPVGITGVVDGSNALPGQVGEFIQGSGTFNYAAYPAVSSGVVSVLVVPPGDWDLWCWATLSGVSSGLDFALSPVPAGISNNMSVYSAVLGPAGIVTQSLELGTPARGNFTVPTLLAFSWLANQSGDPSMVAGTGTINVEGRRRR